VADWPEPCIAESRSKFGDVRPTIEADAEGVRLQYAVHLAKGRFHPCEVVTLNRPAGAGSVAVHIRKIGKNEIHAASGNFRQYLGAIAVNYRAALLIRRKMDR